MKQRSLSIKASVRIALSILAWAALSGCAHLAKHETLRFGVLEPSPRHVKGILTLPEEAKNPVPVVVLVHGTAGIDSRERTVAFLRQALDR